MDLSGMLMNWHKEGKERLLPISYDWMLRLVQWVLSRLGQNDC